MKDGFAQLARDSERTFRAVRKYHAQSERRWRRVKRLTCIGIAFMLLLIVARVLIACQPPDTTGSVSSGYLDQLPPGTVISTGVHEDDVDGIVEWMERNRK